MVGDYYIIFILYELFKKGFGHFWANKLKQIKVKSIIKLIFNIVDCQGRGGEAYSWREAETHS